jgi:hypothetical protein
MKKLLLASLALCLTVAACKKGGDGNGTVTRKDTLTNGRWQVFSLMGRVDLGGTPTDVDFFSFGDSCDRDNIFIFNKDGSLTNDAGARKCSSTDPQQSPGGTWQINAGMDTLSFDGGTLPGKFVISSFSNSSMQLKKDTSLFGFTGTITATLNHQ